MTQKSITNIFYSFSVISPTAFAQCVHLLDHDELEEIAIEKWLFTEVIDAEEGKATTESNVTSSNVASPERGQGNLGHHHRSRGRHGGLADQMADNAAHGNIINPFIHN